MRLEVGDAVIWNLASDYIHKPISWVLVLGQLEAKTFKIWQGSIRRSEEDCSTT
jgi:hypothetical protein